MRIVFLGTPEFAINSLKELYERFGSVFVITQPDKPAGRGQRITSPPVKSFAKDKNLPVFQPQTKLELENLLTELKPDLGVVVAYGKILSKRALDSSSFGFLNLHASLLPLYRGASPIQRAIMAGETKTGISIMLMDEGLDTGGVLSRLEVPIYEEDNLETLSKRLSELGAKHLLETIDGYISGKLKPQPQDDSLATYAPIIYKQETRLCWRTGAKVLKDKVRGLFPDAHFLTPQGERVKVLKATLSELEGEPGEILSKERLIIGCAEGALEITYLISPKGKKMTGREFLNGYRFSYVL
ncbi:MAG: methionyl-tRNA formyltransferase [Aquificaceae bacterium]|nr:methionyl-tRNA formyltransferase [Aquificaceae bacterium]